MEERSPRWQGAVAPDEAPPLSVDEHEALARLGEGWPDGPATIDAIRGEPQGHLLSWLISAGAAGVLAGGFWWREMTARKRDPMARPEQIDTAIAEFARQVGDVAQITVAMQAGLERLRERQKRILATIDQSCTKSLP